MTLPKNNVDDVLDTLRQKLPVVFARCDVPELLGGVIAHGTLANCDSAKKGPEGVFCQGRKVCYIRDPFLTWLGQRLSRP